MAHSHYRKFIVSVNSEKQPHIVDKIEQAKREEGISSYLIRLIEQDLKQAENADEKQDAKRILQIIDIMMEVGIDEREILKSLFSVLSTAEKKDSSNRISQKISSIAGIV